MIAKGPVEEAFPPLISIGKEWYRYSDGCWRKFTIEEYHPQIMELMPGKYKTARHVSSIVESSADEEPNAIRQCQRRVQHCPRWCDFPERCRTGY